MSVLIFDIETNGISDFRTLDDLRTIHCIVIKDANTGEVTTYNTEKDNIDEGVALLGEADCIVGHNSVGFDVPAIQRLYPDWSPSKVLDTLILSRLVWPDLRNDDWSRESLPRNLVGSHSLKSWGYRLGFHKGEFGETTDWSSWSPEMESYCVTDVELTDKLLQHIKNNIDMSIDAVDLEHEFAACIHRQWVHGIGFDTEKAGRLHAQLMKCLLSIEEELQSIFPPKEELMKTREYWITDDSSIYSTKKEAVAAGYKGILLQPGPFKVKKIPFNPSSRLMIGQAFIEKYGWEPSEFTPEGRPKVDETILRSLPYPEAAPLAEYLMLTKRLGQLVEGKESWMRLEKNGRIHGRVNTNGAVTGRCTHSKPNTAQIPNAHAPWGKECRSLFTPTNQWDVMVGVDASGLELRCLAHYLARYDNGSYANEILEGDIHTANQKAAGLDERNDAKTFIYAYLYGAGDEKIGQIINGGRQEGRRLKQQFLAQLPALRHLKEQISYTVANRGHLLGLDGRVLKIRSEHSALNTLLQSAGAVLMKKATVIMNQRFQDEGMSVYQVAHVHDEVQFECPPEIAESVGEIAVQAIKDAGTFFNFRCPLDGEYRIGTNWSETH